MVGHLTIEQKDLLVGQEFAADSYFYPIQDAQDRWVISIEEINYCTAGEFQWVKDLPLIEFEPKIEEI